MTLTLPEAIELIKTAKKNGNTVFVCGNGGSSATAEHFTNDLFSRGVRAHCLNSNTSIITMIANDYGYKYIFSKQLKVFYRPGDVIVLFSCSGTSPNIVEVLSLELPNTVRIFGGVGTYEAMEDVHLMTAHSIAEVLGDKSI